MGNIRQWLDSLGLAEYADEFEANAVDLRTVSALSEDDLKELGVKLGHRRLLQQAIPALREEVPTSVTPPEREQASRPLEGGEAERRQLTVMFCDLVGSTELSQQLDPEDLRTVIGACQDCWVAAIKRYAGFVARYMGDGLLVYFGYPHAHEDDAERAIRAALDIVDATERLDIPGLSRVNQRLHVRTGIATGPVVVGDLVGEGASRESPVIGETPNLASRLQGIADPDTVFVSAGTHRLVRGQFVWEQVGDRLLKGMAEPVPVWRVLGQRETDSRFEARHGGQMTPLVGREQEVALILDRWDQARNSEGQVVVLVGEAGVGKSRITMSVKEQTSGNSPIRLQYQCSPHHTDSALYPVLEQLSRVAGIGPDDATENKLDKLESLLNQSTTELEAVTPVIAELLSIPYDGRYPLMNDGPDQKREKALQTLISQLEGLCRRGPVLIVFEDLHWADPTSLDLLDRMIERVRNLPALILLTFRPEFSLNFAFHSNITSLRLNRLPGTLVKAMIQTLTGGKGLPEEVSRQIVEKTDGIPLFVEELTQSILESGVVREFDDQYQLAEAIGQASVPTTLFDSLIARLDRLGTAKEVAQLAATLGRTFDYSLLAAISGRDPTQLDPDLARLLEAELIFQRGRPPDVTFEFKHALVRDAAYQSLLKSTRKKYHQRVVEVLEEKMPKLIESQPELLAHHCCQAELAARAIEYWQRAGMRTAHNASHDEAISHYTKALGALNSLGNTIDTARLDTEIRIPLADSMRIVDRNDDALETLEKAEAVAREHGFALQLSRIHHLRGNLFFPMGNLDGCQEQHQAALELARRADSPEDEARALGGIADAAYMRGQMQSAYEYFSKCIDLCRIHEFASIRSSNFSMVAHTRQYLNELSDALADGQDAAGFAKSRGNHRAEIIALNAVCNIMNSMNRSAQAEEYALRSVRLTRQIGARRLEGIALNNLAEVEYARGQEAEAIRRLEEAISICYETGTTFVGPWVLGRMAVLTSDDTRRLAALAEGDVIIEDQCVGHNYLWFYRDAIIACLALGDWDRADRYADKLEAYTRSEPLPWSLYFAAWGRALARSGRGARDEETVRCLQDLLDEARRSGLQVAVPRLEEALGVASAAE